VKLVHTIPITAPQMPGPVPWVACRDLGLANATDGRMQARVIKVKTGMTQPTGWHCHVCDAVFTYVLKGRVEGEFADGAKLRAEAGVSVFIPGGVIHQEARTSGDFEILEISVPAYTGTVPSEPSAPPTR
jgi:quercetin dioxygenase-like cupin family protein